MQRPPVHVVPEMHRPWPSPHGAPSARGSKHVPATQAASLQKQRSFSVQLLCVSRVDGVHGPPATERDAQEPALHQASPRHPGAVATQGCPAPGAGAHVPWEQYESGSQSPLTVGPDAQGDPVPGGTLQ